LHDLRPCLSQILQKALYLGGSRARAPAPHQSGHLLLRSSLSGFRLRPLAARLRLRSRNFSRIFTFSEKLSAANRLRISCLLIGALEPAYGTRRSNSKTNGRRPLCHLPSTSRG